jgi:hypothetical protein
VKQEQRWSIGRPLRAFVRDGDKLNEWQTIEWNHRCGTENPSNFDKAAARHDIDGITRNLGVVSRVVRVVIGLLGVSGDDKTHVGRQLTHVAQYDEQGRDRQQPSRRVYNTVPVHHGV